MKQEKIEKLKDLVFAFFEGKKGVDLNKKQTYNRILGYLWYVLHYTYGLSSAEIMREYNIQRRWVFKVISRTKYRISMCKVEMQEFAELTKYLQDKGFYPIYE